MADYSELRAKVQKVLYDKGYNGHDRGMVDDVLHVIVNEMRLTIAPLRQAGWIDPDVHTLIDLEAEDDYYEEGWRPIWELGKGAVGVPPLTLDDDDAVW